MKEVTGKIIMVLLALGIGLYGGQTLSFPQEDEKKEPSKEKRTSAKSFAERGRRLGWTTEPRDVSLIGRYALHVFLNWETPSGIIGPDRLASIYLLDTATGDVWYTNEDRGKFTEISRSPVLLPPKSIEGF